jgi:hypothetical protein
MARAGREHRGEGETTRISEKYLRKTDGTRQCASDKPIAKIVGTLPRTNQGKSRVYICLFARVNIYSTRAVAQARIFLGFLGCRLSFRLSEQFFYNTFISAINNIHKNKRNNNNKNNLGGRERAHRNRNTSPCYGRGRGKGWEEQYRG